MTILDSAFDNATVVEFIADPKQFGDKVSGADKGRTEFCLYRPAGAKELR